MATNEGFPESSDPNLPGAAEMNTAADVDFDARIGDFLKRQELFTQYCRWELGAYSYFRQITQASSTNGRPPVINKWEAGKHGDGVMTVLYPPVTYESEGDASWIILLSEEQRHQDGRMVSKTPWLEVYTPDDWSQHPYDSDHAEEVFARDDIETMCGSSDWDGADELQEILFCPGDTGLNDRLAVQSRYIEWLHRAAYALGMPRIFESAAPPELDQYPN